MLHDLPLYVTVTFILTTFLTLGFFINAVKNSTHSKLTVPIAIGMFAWLGLQLGLSLSGFYSENTGGFPPRFALSFAPTLLLILGLFLTKKGKAFIDGLPLVELTYLNVVRIPVEFVLYWLFLGGAVPELMTFVGRNFDILAGLTAPFIAYYGLQRKVLSNRMVLAWNILGTGLLLFIIVNGLLSAPTVLQQFAFEQPNIALLYFPYVWLPAFIVPVVLFGHFVAIRRLVMVNS